MTISKLDVTALQGGFSFFRSSTHGLNKNEFFRLQSNLAVAACKQPNKTEQTNRIAGFNACLQVGTSLELICAKIALRDLNSHFPKSVFMFGQNEQVVFTYNYS